MYESGEINGAKNIMRTIDIGIEKIDKIYHIADVHVRNVKRHKEYQLVFKRLYTYIRKTKTPNSLIYVAGDIVHAKTDMSPELINMVSDFFKNLQLSNRCKNIFSYPISIFFYSNNISTF